MPLQYDSWRGFFCATRLSITIVWIRNNNLSITVVWVRNNDCLGDLRSKAIQAPPTLASWGEYLD